ncbi:MAG TPA: ATP-dependent DNA helicase RecG [Acidimicrobiia bacterium]|nr:ATP-dependent DNA helicase RecG [Acidimicrobiia bacterium]
MPTGDPPLTLRELRAIDLARLKGVGDALEAKLAEMDLHNVLDLLQHYPRRWIDRTKRVEIAALEVGEEATVIGEVRSIHGRRTRQGRALVEAVVHDGSSLLNVTFFNQGWREKQLAVGTEVSLFGKLDVYRGKRQMTMPVVDVLGRAGVADDKTGVILPVYPQSGKAEVFTWQLRALVGEALAKCKVRGFADPVDEELLDRHDLVDRTVAMRAIHRPESMAEQRAAYRRLVFDEFLRMQVGLVARKRALAAEESGIRHTVDGPLVQAFLDQLPFTLTTDQTKAITEITHDMAGAAPMHRLLQGDVGSGKTVVALASLLVAVQGGYQGAFMAPTEVLAEQHYLGSVKLLEGLTVSAQGAQGSLLGDRPVRVELLTNRTTAAERRRIAKGLAGNEVDILVGTHALLYGDAEFTNLGFAVIDEQHRFGVEQRALLKAKAGTEIVPDVLVMTATPIPRTAAMLVYGDLDKSELREMPPGRTPIATKVVGREPLDQVAMWKRLRDEVAAAHQAYVVCPLVEDKGKIEAKAATAEFERLQAEELAGLRLGLLHGQLPSKEKESVMAAFRAGALDVLVATTVIEVGVDVANATVMIVEDADRFGLSQLHQLRGRVGRGADASWCYLVAEPTTADGEARMEAIAASVDGFLLAEKDLEIRGAGEVFGAKQSGMNDLKLGRIPRDEEIVLETRAAAEEILDADPALAAHDQLREEVEDLLGDDVEFLFKS